MEKSDENYCNERTFSNFFERHSQPLNNYIFYKCGDLGQAKDLVQDAFLKFWENCHKVTNGGAKSYLYTIASNLFLNEYARSKVVLKYKNIPKKNYTTESPDFLLEEQEFKTKLLNAISDLSEAQRTAFLLNRIDGKKYKEIAVILNISVKAVEKRIHNALINIRKNIDNI